MQKIFRPFCRIAMRLLHEQEVIDIGIPSKYEENFLKISRSSEDILDSIKEIISVLGTGTSLRQSGVMQWNTK